MKRIIKTIVMILIVLSLSGCDFSDIFQKQPCTKEECGIYETEEVTNRILETSDSLRLSNIHIKKIVYEKNALGGPRLYASRSAEGSGFVFYDDGTHYYALTNFHVIDTEISPTRLYSVEYEITLNYVKIKTGVTVLVSGDDILDLAVIRFPKSDIVAPLVDLTQRSSTGALPGEFLLVAGNPGGTINVISSSKVISICNCLNGIDYNVIYFELNMQSPGNSGGAVTDIDGNLLGIITWQNPEDFKRKFAIPLSKILEFLDENDISFSTTTE